MVEVIRRGREELLDKIAIAYKAVLPRIPQRPSKTPVRLVGKLRWCAVGSFNNIRLLLLKFDIPNWITLQFFHVGGHHTLVERLCFEALWWLMTLPDSSRDLQSLPASGGVIVTLSERTRAWCRHRQSGLRNKRLGAEPLVLILNRIIWISYRGFLKWWYPTTMGFPTKSDHFGVNWGYHHLRKHPYGSRMQ